MSKPSHAAGSALISHGTHPASTVEDRVALRANRLRELGDLPGATVDQQIALLNELTSFEFGRFLLEHGGLNGYWTHEVVTYGTPDEIARPRAGLELRLLEQLPAVIATRERFAIFRKQLQERLTSGFTAASVPCGLMGELLLLDYSGHPDLKLIGIDLDQHALDGAQMLAQTRQLADRLTLRQGDAWSTGLKGEVDLLASNGLNIYEPDNERVIALYRSFHDALKPGGTLVTSFLTPPPMLSPDSPWDMSALDPAALAFQHLLFTRVIEAKWNVFRTHAQATAQLEEAGFTGVEFIDDRARLFPTVIARKSP
jgi:SAM-dependent methyltransferase